MNLNRVLDEVLRKLLKVHGIYVSDNMNREEMEDFYNNLLSSGMDLDIVNAIMRQIEDYESKVDTTDINNYR